MLHAVLTYLNGDVLRGDVLELEGDRLARNRRLHRLHRCQRKREKRVKRVESFEFPSLPQPSLSTPVRYRKAKKAEIEFDLIIAERDAIMSNEMVMKLLLMAMSRGRFENKQYSVFEKIIDSLARMFEMCFSFFFDKKSKFHEIIIWKACKCRFWRN